VRKILIIARREYRAMVGTKAFLIALTMMPVLMLGGIAVHAFLRDRVETEDKTIVVVDHTGSLFGPLAKAADAHNRSAAAGKTEEGHSRTRFLLEEQDAADVSDELRLALSDRVRDGEIHAFVEIPANVSSAEPGQGGRSVRFHAENPMLSDARRWLQATLNEIIRTRRLKELGIDPAVVDEADRPVPFQGLGLLQRAAGGGVSEAAPKGEMLEAFVPFGAVMLMFLVVFLAAQPTLEAVLEEKTQRIVEVLLSSANPFQLMCGKLLGSVGGSLTVVAVYMTGGYFLARHFEVADLLPLHLLPWFLLFQVLAVLFFSSIFLAVGASVNQLKEAQALLLPVWLVMMIPMFVWFPVLQEPTGSLATGLSLFPPATPFLMVLRMAATQAIPLWQPLLGIAILTATTLLCVFAASRIFRIGILSQGKTPKLRELLRWAVRG